VVGASRGISGSNGEGGVLLGGCASDFARGCAGKGVGRVVALTGGIGGRVGAGAGYVVAPVRGTGGREGAGAWGGGAAETVCDRSLRNALMGASLLSRAVKVGRVATIDRIVPSWVVMVLS